MDIIREALKELNESLNLNKDFYDKLPSFACEHLDNLILEHGEEDWFEDAWNKYRNHILNSDMENMKMPGLFFDFNKHLDARTKGAIKKGWIDAETGRSINKPLFDINEAYWGLYKVNNEISDEDLLKVIKEFIPWSILKYDQRIMSDKKHDKICDALDIPVEKYIYNIEVDEDSINISNNKIHFTCKLDIGTNWDNNEELEKEVVISKDVLLDLIDRQFDNKVDMYRPERAIKRALCKVIINGLWVTEPTNRLGFFESLNESLNEDLIIVDADKVKDKLYALKDEIEKAEGNLKFFLKDLFDVYMYHAFWGGVPTSPEERDELKAKGISTDELIHSDLSKKEWDELSEWEKGIKTEFKK